MGFFEILLIAVVSLFVVGPERMPEAVRSVALTIGRIKRTFNSARDEIEKQIGTDDIRRQLHNESVMDSLNKVKEGLSDIDKSIDSAVEDMSWADDDEFYEKEQRMLHAKEAEAKADVKPSEAAVDEKAIETEQNATQQKTL